MADGDFLSWITSGLPQWAGGTFGQAASVPAVTNQDGTTSIGGWTWAPGMTQAGYGLPTSGPATSSGGLGGGVGGGDLAKALQGLGKSMGAQPTTDASQAKPQNIAAAPMGQPHSSLDNLVKMLIERRAQYSQLTGQPVQQKQTQGLLGF